MAIASHTAALGSPIAIKFHLSLSSESLSNKYKSQYSVSRLDSSNDVLTEMFLLILLGQILYFTLFSLSIGKFQIISA